jgi:hypothetical protein
MAAFPGADGSVVIVRNHEIAPPRGVFSSRAPVWDPAARGGTTTLVFDPELGELREAFASLAGTVANCAGALAAGAPRHSTECQARRRRERPEARPLDGSVFLHHGVVRLGGGQARSGQPGRQALPRCTS